MTPDKIDEDIQYAKRAAKYKLYKVSKLEYKIEELAHMIVYKQFIDSDSISFSQFVALPLNVELPFPTLNDKKISARKTCQRDDEIIFEADFDGYAVLPRHRHDDCDEVMTVTSDSTFKFMIGKEVDGTFQKRTLVKGDTIIIKATVEHQIINLSSTSGHIHTKLIKR